MLIIDCCLRGEESATRKYYKAFIEKQGIENECEELYLSDCDIRPLDGESIEKRTELLMRGETADAMFALARQLRDAEEILIAAPYWDMSFPSLLKVYIEQVCVAGITFRYTETGSVGLCKAKRLLYFTTCGGFTGENDLGYAYIKAVASMLGIENCTEYKVEGLDIEPSLRDRLLEQAIEKL